MIECSFTNYVVVSSNPVAVRFWKDCGNFPENMRCRFSGGDLVRCYMGVFDNIRFINIDKYRY